MDMSTSVQRELVGQSQRAHIEDLLGRYPDVSAAETAEILRFIKKGPPLEVGLLTARDHVRPQLDRFKRDHAKEFSLGLKEYFFVALIVAALVGLCAYLWDSGVRP